MLYWSVVEIWILGLDMFYNKTVAIYLILITSIMQYGCSLSEDEIECNDTYLFPEYSLQFEADNNKILSLIVFSIFIVFVSAFLLGWTGNSINENFDL